MRRAMIADKKFVFDEFGFVVGLVVEEGFFVVVLSCPEGQGWTVWKLQLGPKQVSLAKL